MSQKCLLEDGQKIVFVGDSITQPADGYVGITQGLIGGLAPQLRLSYVNAGIGGHKVTDLFGRADSDIIAPDPDWITLSIGINDVWHGVNGVPIEQFRERYDELIAKLQKQTRAKLALFTTTVIAEDLENEANGKLVDYNDFIRETAKRRECLLVPMNEEFRKAIQAWHSLGETDLKFTSDGVHMSPAGDSLMAVTLCRAWGVL